MLFLLTLIFDLLTAACEPYFYAQAKQRQLQNNLLARDRPYATVEHLVESVRRAAMRFLDEQVSLTPLSKARSF